MVDKLLNTMLEKIEEKIDLAHVEEVEQLHLDAMHYKKVSRIPLTVEYKAEEETFRFPYTEMFADPRKMLYNELVTLNDSIWNHVRIQDDYPLQIRPNYGIGLISSLFGAKIDVRDDTMPWVVPLDGEEVFRKVISHGVPDLKGGLAEKIFEAYEVYAEYLRPYPKCSRAIHLVQPDMQGPFDNLELIRGEEAFYDFYDDPEMVHESMSIMADTMIAFQKSLPHLNDRAGEDCYYIHRAVYGGNILLKLDTETAMLSEAMYEEFCKPYNERVLNALGGGSIHFCGGGLEWHARQMPKHNITCMNFGNPEKHDLFSEWADARKKKISFVGFGNGMPYSYILEQMERGIDTGVTFFCTVDRLDEAKRIVADYRER